MYPTVQDVKLDQWLKLKDLLQCNRAPVFAVQ